MTREERIAKLDELIRDANAFLGEYEKGTNGFRLPPVDGKAPEDMDVDPKQQEAYDEYRADWNESAMVFVNYLAALSADNCEG
jgi:hypothetical protein